MIALVVTLRGYDGAPNSDSEDVLAWCMLALGFPSSLLFPAAFSLVAATRALLGGGEMVVSYWSLLASWFCLSVLGYVQWFVLLPVVIRKARARLCREATK